MPRVYTEGDLRAVLRQRAAARAAHTDDPEERSRSAALVAALAAGNAVEVTVEQLLVGLWHAGLINADTMHAMRNAAAAAGTERFKVAPDGAYEAAA
jgi:hypothetical protein